MNRAPANSPEGPGGADVAAAPTPSLAATAVIVAAGRGERFGAPDKVFLPLAGRPLLAYALDAAERAEAIRDVVLVVGEHTREAAEALLAAGAWSKVAAVVTGGARRQDSVAAGVAAVPAGTAVVVIHDGARPLAPAALFDRCAAVAADVGGAIAAVPVTDTLKRVAHDRIAATVPRDALWAAQTPQAFRHDLLVRALASPETQSATFTDEAGLFETLGLPVAIVKGVPSNVKVTRPSDLAIAEAFLARTVTPPLPGGGTPAPEPVPSAAAQDSALSTQHSALRTGIGYDVHRFAPGRRLVLGGVEISHPRGLEGHSDADVLLHAIADALLGAAALGDIGQHFPPSDPRYRDADSRELLSRVAGLLRAAGYHPVNVDATLIAEAPRIGPHVPAMRGEIARCLGIDAGAVGVKATTNERMGFVGRGEGIAALAVATIATAAEGA